MDKETWIRAQRVFHRLLETPRELQQQVLLQLCGDDETLRHEVESMLAEDLLQEGLLDGSIAGLAHAMVAGVADPDGPSYPEQVGSFRILGLLGAGGMGSVYLAERAGVGGQAAVKVLRDAWVSPERRRRFALEQSMLAQLNHPGIAKLFDANTLPDGTPWFAMEYVNGVSITDYWSSQQSGIEQCLLLFRSVCEAVLYAHRRAIIHRDLKPSNILVNAEGSVKLLDFGIAKHLDDREMRSEITVEGMRPMTPAYAAPEQLSGGPVGVFTDVYALGILLYRLLTGVLPFDDAATGQIERPAPLRPSQAFTESQFTPPLSRSEWNDLNVLCLTAMRVEPERRYASVEAMIRDVNAFLEQRPLDARSDSWTYRLRKFMVRRRVRLTYAAVTAIALLSIIGFFTYRLSEARNAALAEAARTERLQQFTSNLFRGNETSVGPADDLRVKTVLDRGRQEASSLDSDPDMQAEMRETLGEIYRKLGDLNQADALLTASLQHWRSEQTRSPQKVARNLLELGRLRIDQARLDEAESLIRDGLGVSRTLSPAGAKARALTADALVSLGMVLEARGSYPQAATFLQRAIEMRAPNENADLEQALNMRELANVYFYEGNYPVAQTLNAQVLTMHRAMYGAKHPEVAEDLNNLAAIQLELGNLKEAEDEFRQALSVTEAWYGPQHPKTAECLTSLARTLIREKQPGRAKPLLERALEIQISAHGHDHPAVASALNELASMELLQKDYAHAEIHFNEALQVWRRIYGEHHQFIGVGLSNVGSVLMAEKKYARAEIKYREALQVFRDTVHEDHLNTAIAHAKLGRCLLRQQHYIEAERESLTAYSILSKLVAPSNNFLHAAQSDLFQIYSALHRPQDADRFR